MIADDFLFVVFIESVTVVLEYWEYDHVVLVVLTPTGRCCLPQFLLRIPAKTIDYSQCMLFEPVVPPCCLFSRTRLHKQL